MASLIAKSATDGLLPLNIGQQTLSDCTPKRITAIAPYQGQTEAVGQALDALGLAWPAPDRASLSAKAACLWSGRGQAFLIDAAPPKGLEASAALTDISDGWVALQIEGAGARDVLARLFPLDLAPAAFPVGATARSGLVHMMALLHRTGPEAFAVYLFRSMARSAIHEFEVAMKALAARASL